MYVLLMSFFLHMYIHCVLIVFSYLILLLHLISRALSLSLILLSYVLCALMYFQLLSFVSRPFLYITPLFIILKYLFVFLFISISKATYRFKHYVIDFIAMLGEYQSTHVKTVYPSQKKTKLEISRVLIGSRFNVTLNLQF